MGLNVKFDFSDIKKSLKQLDTEVVNEMRSAGDLALTISVAEGSYQNRTGNLRSANGYVIAEEGKIIEEKIANTFSKTEAQKYTREELRNTDLSGRCSLIIANGMPYASFVEKKGFSVLSMAKEEVKAKLGI